MRHITAVTVGRSDYGILKPVLNRIAADEELDLDVLVGGMHLSPEFGLTVNAIVADGFRVEERVECLLSSDTPCGISKSVGLGVIGFAQAFSRLQPDMLILTGDRFEMHAAAVAALPFQIPIAHLHGGELSAGAIDDSLRHCVTKLSHLHFVSTPEHARRVHQLGEEPWRITVSGAPALDSLQSFRALSESEIERRIGVSPRPRPLLVTFHPATLGHQSAADQVTEVLAALSTFDLPIIFTGTNADTGGRSILTEIRNFAASRPNTWLFDNLGSEVYFSLMSYARAMAGNSSSGIIEAPSFRLPVVNIGDRQAGRLRACNVIDAICERGAIQAAVDQALSAEFREVLGTMTNPYVAADGPCASERIVSRLKSVELNERLTTKRFVDLAPSVDQPA